mmetsp:Transcript_29797/g.65106  ORF Transcript_29797/g.65106 Transcript_29797/m.65106 type:complete len:708 (-) Transcript_29797:521-2644(-)|eukprot:CAMPEP_0118924986 /NCGR_PEP_ID=MMETSP1169-20130426/2917_1 /TAXON_ID=36882 /ORGANISM="Pyramimonas obovata, Strain CCMP722" /LENGTH=707 /DNA_ID=CAMNT_0006866157 /DNA_START=72 /DNA_END=2195 /DNA_ORIENTATION=-
MDRLGKELSDLTSREKVVLDKQWKVQALKTVQAKLKDQLQRKETVNPRLHKRMQEQMRLQMPQESRFAKYKTIGCVLSIVVSAVMAVALILFVLSDVVKVETMDIEDIADVGGGLEISSERSDSGRDILASKAIPRSPQDVLEDVGDEGGEEGDNNQVGGFDGVYQEVIKPLDPEALPEGAGLQPEEESPGEPEETAAEPEEEPEEEPEKAAKEKTAKTTAFVPSAQELKARVKSQQEVMKANPQKLLVAKKAVSNKGLVVQEPAEYTAQTVKPPKEWPKKASILYKGMVFKNPPELQYSHMSTVTRLPPTAPYRYMVAWQTGKRVEGVDGQHLRASFSDDAKTWTEPRVIPVGEKAVWSPVLFTHEGYVYLFYSVSTTCLRAKTSRRPERWAPGGDILVTKSVDGITWGPPISIYKQDSDTSGIPKVIANQPDVTPDGKMVLPYWKERPSQETCHTAGHATAGVLVSDGSGENWKAYGEITSRGTWLIEGTVARRPDGNLLQLFRTKKGAIFQSTSADGGKSWGTVTSLGLPNPNSKIDAIRLTSGELVMCYNDSPRSRNRLRVAISADGAKWRLLADLEMPGEAKFAYAYPTMAQDGDKLLVTYSVWRKARNIPLESTGVRVVLIQLPRPGQEAKKSAPKLGLVTVEAKGPIDFEKDTATISRRRRRAGLPPVPGATPARRRRSRPPAADAKATAAAPAAKATKG